jgi:hypothetical protein
MYNASQWAVSAVLVTHVARKISIVATLVAQKIIALVGSPTHMITLDGCDIPVEQGGILVYFGPVEENHSMFDSRRRATLFH